MQTAMRVPLVVLFVAVLVSLTVLCEGLPWLSMGTAPISGGYGQSVLSAEDMIYVLRCSNASDPVLFFRYDPSGGSWADLSTFGLSDGAFRNGTSLAWDNVRYVYALGGARYGDEDRREFFRYDTETDTWMALGLTPYPQGAGNALTWAGYDSMLYGLLGSRSHDGDVSRFVRYDPETASWETLQSPWKNTDDGASLAWTGGDYIFALRGEYIEMTPSFDFSRYDISANLWEPMANFPGYGGIGDGGSLLWIGQSMLDHADLLYALSGGEVDEDPGFDLYTYSLESNEWNEAGSIPCPIGYYVGNRLGYASGSIFYWQGSPGSDKWLCGGDAFFSATIEENQPDLDPCPECLSSINGASLDEFSRVSGIGDTKSQALVSAQPFAVDVCTRDAILVVLDEVYGIGAMLSEQIVQHFCPQFVDSD